MLKNKEFVAKAKRKTRNAKKARKGRTGSLQATAGGGGLRSILVGVLAERKVPEFLNFGSEFYTEKCSELSPIFLRVFCACSLQRQLL